MDREDQPGENDFAYQPSHEQKEQLELLQELLTRLEQQGVRFILAGGYGLDALYGSLTRNHKDYDFLVFDESVADFESILSELGFEHQYTKDSNVPVCKHSDIDVELEYSTAGNLQRIWESEEAADLDLEVNTASGTLAGISVPTFSLKMYQAFDQLQNERFKAPDPQQAHKEKLYTVIEKNV